MTTLWRREKCPRKRSKKESCSGVGCPRDAKPAPPGAAVTPWTETELNLAGEGCLVYSASCNWSVKTEIPA
jgi:hypothetical protein